ncbi:MAG: O-antigen ligase family protein [Bryobacteraceae bacterium]
MASASVQQRRFSSALTAAPPRRLFPAWLSQEWFFWLIFASWTILPSTSTPWWEIAGIEIKSVDALTIVFCLLYAVPRIASPSNRLPRGWHLWLPFSLIALAAWGMVSTSWSGAGPRNNLAMGYCMALTAASGILAYLVISSVSDVRGFLWRLVVALSCVCALYTAQSVLGLGLRDAAAVTLNDFGMERVRGPLFEASTGYFLLIPAMAFALQETLARRVKPIFGVLCVFCLALTTIGLGSRAGMMLFGLFILSCVWAAKGLTKITVLVIVLLIGGAAATVIFSKAKADRLENQARGPDGRTMMHEAVANIMSDRSPAQLLVGSGLGSWWPWYLTETEGGDLYTSGRYVRYTRYGILLYHPHSTILDLVVELGLPGLLFLLFLAAALWTALRRAMRSDENKILAAGILVSLASIAFDLFLVRRPTRDGVWWLFVFGLLALVAKGIQGRRRVYP